MRKIELEKDLVAPFIKSILRTNSVVCVNFLKKNGEQRKMLCTLQEDMIPTDKQPKNNDRKNNSNQICVYDVEKDAWRSFLADRVISIEGA